MLLRYVGRGILALLSFARASRAVSNASHESALWRGSSRIPGDVPLSFEFPSNIFGLPSTRGIGHSGNPAVPDAHGGLETFSLDVSMRVTQQESMEPKLHSTSKRAGPTDCLGDKSDDCSGDDSKARKRENTFGPRTGVLPQSICGVQESIADCDIIVDGKCILTAESRRSGYRRRRRKSLARGISRGIRKVNIPEDGKKEHRLVNGLRITTAGDIEVRGASFVCTGAADKGWNENRGKHSSRFPTKPYESPPTSAGEFERIQLCAGGRILIKGASRLHCQEVVLIAGEAVFIGEEAEISADATSSGPAPQALWRREATPPEGVEEAAAILWRTLEVRSSCSHVDTWQRKKCVSTGGDARHIGGQMESRLISGPGTSGLRGVSQRESLGTQLNFRGDWKRRGGSHGGMGGLSSEQCNPTAFSSSLNLTPSLSDLHFPFSFVPHPLAVVSLCELAGHPLELSVPPLGDVFLPTEFGEAGSLFEAARDSPGDASTSDAGGAVPTRRPKGRPPRGGGFVALQSFQTIEIEGRVSASGEDGWLSSFHSSVPLALPETGQETPPPGPASASGVRGGVWWSRLRFAVRLANRLLLGEPVRVRAIETRPFSDAAGALEPREGASAMASLQPSLGPSSVDASGGAGGSVLIIARTVAFPRASGASRVLAAGGGCVASFASSPSSALAGETGGGRGRNRKPETTADGAGPACPGGGGGRVAIYSEVAHPLDPTVSGGGAAVSLSPKSCWAQTPAGGSLCLSLRLRLGCDFQVKTPGGCPSESWSRIPSACLCGGAGTVYSHFHRRLQVKNAPHQHGGGSPGAAAGQSSEVPREETAKTAVPCAAEPDSSASASGREGAAALQKGSCASSSSLRVGGREDSESSVVVEQETQPTPPGANFDADAATRSSGALSVEVLSVNPTILPLPLVAPTVTLAVESAVAAFADETPGLGAAAEGEGGGDGSEGEERAGSPALRRIEVGSLVLHGRDRGE